MHTSCAKKARARGFPTQMYTKSGGLAGISFCGCTAKVRFLILHESPQLKSRIHRRVLSWLRKVGINVSSFVVIPILVLTVAVHPRSSTSEIRYKMKKY